MFINDMSLLSSYNQFITVRLWTPAINKWLFECLFIGELDSDEPDVVYNVRQKLCTLSSCFAQLTHKAQTIFQNSTKIEVIIANYTCEIWYYVQDFIDSVIIIIIT